MWFVKDECGVDTGGEKLLVIALPLEGGIMLCKGDKRWRCTLFHSTKALRSCCSKSIMR